MPKPLPLTSFNLPQRLKHYQTYLQTALPKTHYFTAFTAADYHAYDQVILLLQLMAECLNLVSKNAVSTASTVSEIKIILEAREALLQLQTKYLTNNQAIVEFCHLIRQHILYLQQNNLAHSKLNFASIINCGGQALATIAQQQINQQTMHNHFFALLLNILLSYEFYFYQKMLWQHKQPQILAGLMKQIYAKQFANKQHWLHPKLQASQLTLLIQLTKFLPDAEAELLPNLLAFAKQRVPAEIAKHWRLAVLTLHTDSIYFDHESIPWGIKHVALYSPGENYRAYLKDAARDYHRWLNVRNVLDFKRQGISDETSIDNFLTQQFGQNKIAKTIFLKTNNIHRWNPGAETFEFFRRILLNKFGLHISVRDAATEIELSQDKTYFQQTTFKPINKIVYDADSGDPLWQQQYTQHLTLLRQLNADNVYQTGHDLLHFKAVFIIPLSTEKNLQVQEISLSYFNSTMHELAYYLKSALLTNGKNATELMLELDQESFKAMLRRQNVVTLKGERV